MGSAHHFLPYGERILDTWVPTSTEIELIVPENVRSSPDRTVLQVDASDLKCFKH